MDHATKILFHSLKQLAEECGLSADVSVSFLSVHLYKVLRELEWPQQDVLTMPPLYLHRKNESDITFREVLERINAIRACVLQTLHPQRDLRAHKLKALHDELLNTEKSQLAEVGRILRNIRSRRSISRN